MCAERQRKRIRQFGHHHYGFLFDIGRYDCGVPVQLHSETDARSENHPGEWRRYRCDLCGVVIKKRQSNERLGAHSPIEGEQTG